MDAVELPEWRWMLVRLSCTTRKSAVSTFSGSLSSVAGMCRSTAMLLRRMKPSTYVLRGISALVPGAWADEAGRKMSEAHECSLRPWLGSRRERDALIHRVFRLIHLQSPGSSRERQYFERCCREVPELAFGAHRPPPEVTVQTARAERTRSACSP